MQKNKRDFNDLKDVVSALRGERGCPWDKEQTERTIKNHLLEETHEIIQAIDNDDHENLKEELGDVMFQLIFLASLAEEKGLFDIFDAITYAYDKYVSRHPHVFEAGRASHSEEILKEAYRGDLKSSEVIKLWDNIKKNEKNSNKIDILDGVSKTLPALLRAHEVTKRVSKVGFDWEKSDGILDKVEEEIAELRVALAENKIDDIEEELGDIIFSLVNLTRFLKINPENALNRTTNKFIKRFAYVQKRADYSLSDKSLETLESFWEEAKKQKI